MKKRFVAIFLTMLISSISVVPVAAASIMPFWVNVKRISLSLTFSSGQANASGIVEGESNTTRISATYSLQEKNGNNWTTVHTWPTVTIYGKLLTFTGSASATQGKTYRLTVNATVTNTAGTSETVSEYLEKTY